MGHLGLGDEVGSGEQEKHSGNWELLNKDIEVKMEGKQYVMTTYCVPETSHCIVSTCTSVCARAFIGITLLF